MLALRNVVQSFQSLPKNKRIVSQEQNVYLHDNFAPQNRAVHQQDLRVEGNVPQALDGAFARIGPNPYLPPTGGYHWFDGDGMVHVCRLKDGKVSYSNRWVETSRLQQEQQAGKPLFGKIGDAIGLAGVAEILLSNIKEPLGILTKKHGQGQANTAMIFHAKRLLALHEADLPYALTVACNGLLETIGRVLDGQVKHPFSAHPKPDPDTGNLYFMGYNVEAPPYCWYSGLDPQGHILFDCPVPLPKGILMHDMQTTEDYAIIIDSNVEFDPQMMVRQDTLPFVFNSGRPSRFGIIDKRQPRGSREPAQVHHWFELEPMSIFHTINAWQEGDVIRMYTCYTPQEELLRSPRSPLEDITAARSNTAEFTFNLKTKQASKRDLAPSIQAEYPKIPKHLQGKPTQYAYVGVRDLEACERIGAPMFGGFAKLELAKQGDGAIVGRLDHGPGKFGSEPFFVAAHSDPSQCDGEDDGYLITYVHDTSAVGEQGSELVIYSAKTMSPQPVARVPLPQRVPYGFHSEHVPEHQFRQQAEDIPYTSVWPTRGTVPQ